jgi:hypothetical protein
MGASTNATVPNEGSTLTVSKHAGHNRKTRMGDGCQLCGEKCSKTVHPYGHIAKQGGLVALLAVRLNRAKSPQ